MTNADKVWIHPGTRLHMLVYNLDTHVWEVWTATDSRSGDSKHWHGTYMELHSDGKCVQRNRTETIEQELVIRPGGGCPPGV